MPNMADLTSQTQLVTVALAKDYIGKLPETLIPKP